MRFKYTFQTIDTHTVGEPTRTIVGGLPVIKGNTMAEKMLYLKEEKDWIRKVLTHEPRGSAVMAGTILTEPCDPRADIGIIHYEGGMYQPMCGHNTIGVSTALVESGMVKVEEPYTHINLDTPAGLVKVKVHVEDRVAKEVTFRNVPAFVAAEDLKVDVPGYGEITLDVSYGGIFYAIVNAEKFGLTVAPENAGKLISVAKVLQKAINEQYPGQFIHPEKPFIDQVENIEFYSAPTKPGAGAKNAVVFPPGAIDRSPCGTGSSAKIALLYKQGKLKMNEEFIHESIIGSLFKCRIIEETEVDGKKAVIPEITGSAYVTGMHTFVIDPDDPFPEGFELGVE